MDMIVQHRGIPTAVRIEQGPEVLRGRFHGTTRGDEVLQDDVQDLLRDPRDLLPRAPGAYGEGPGGPGEGLARLSGPVKPPRHLGTSPGTRPAKGRDERGQQGQSTSTSAITNHQS